MFEDRLNTYSLLGDRRTTLRFSAYHTYFICICIDICICICIYIYVTTNTSTNFGFIFILDANKNTRKSFLSQVVQKTILARLSALRLLRTNEQIMDQVCVCVCVCMRVCGAVGGGDDEVGG